MNIDSLIARFAFGGSLTPAQWELIHKHNTAMIKDLTERIHALETTVGGCCSAEPAKKADPGSADDLSKGPKRSTTRKTSSSS